MSVRTAILADTPLGYWPLDDPTGPAFSDASGNGRALSPWGGSTTHQPGPEPGTYALDLLGNGCGSPATFPTAARPWSMEVWVAFTQNPPAANANVLYYGDSGRSGSGLIVQPSGANWQLTPIRGAVGYGSTIGVISIGPWHQVAFTHDAANNFVAYVDGKQVSSQTGQTANNPAAGDRYVWIGQSPLTARFAHLAFWQSILTGAQIGAHYSAASVIQSTSGNVVASLMDVNTIFAKLDAIKTVVDANNTGINVLLGRSGGGLTADEKSELDQIRDAVRRSWP
jgi:hypothetical protein